jgi:hypothetical protein
VNLRLRDVAQVGRTPWSTVVIEDDLLVQISEVHG